MTAKWDCDTPWRQGHVLSHKDAVALNLINPDSTEKKFVVIISHDCDLARDLANEQSVEVIVASQLEYEKQDGSYTYAKNVRKLHLEYQYQETVVFAELQATGKTFVPKEQLAEFQPNADIRLDANGLDILQRWLAARYRRAAFPNEFVDRLQTADLHNIIAKKLKPHGNFIRSIYFDVDEGNDFERQGPEDVYSLDIIVLYATNTDPDQALNAAVQVCNEIGTAFKSKLYDPTKVWIDIELRDCIPISDEALSVKQSDHMKEWRLEYMSLRQKPS
jgi:hypothetical protein